MKIKTSNEPVQRGDAFVSPPRLEYHERLKIKIMNDLSDLSAYFTDRDDGRRFSVNKAWHLLNDLA